MTLGIHTPSKVASFGTKTALVNLGHLRLADRLNFAGPPGSTGDILFTGEVLCRLSYEGWRWHTLKESNLPARIWSPSRRALDHEGALVDLARIELATSRLRGGRSPN